MKNRKIIFKCRVGSHLYGLNTPESDEDFVSVFVPLMPDVIGLHKMEVVDNSTKSSSEDRRNTKEDVDDKSYSLHKFLQLLLDNNPNILEMLFATPENIITLEPEYQYLIDNYDKIVSQRSKHKFSGYAYAQRKKIITKRDRYFSLREAMKYLEELISANPINPKFSKEETLEYIMTIENNKQYRIITEAESEELNKRLKYYKSDKHNCESFHKGMDIGMIYRKVRGEYEKYGWRVKTESFETLGYDTKFAYHLIRLLAEGIELLETGKLVYPISGKTKEDIMRVRNGEVSYDELMDMYEVYNNKLEEASQKTTNLPHSSDKKWANKWLIKTLMENFFLEMSNGFFGV